MIAPRALTFFNDALGHGACAADGAQKRLAAWLEGAAAAFLQQEPSREHGAPGLLKRDRQVLVARVEDVVVKGWRDASWWSRMRDRARRRALSAMVGGGRLATSGVMAPRVLAWLCLRKPIGAPPLRAVLVMEDLPRGAWELDRVVAELARPEARERATAALLLLFAALGRTLARMLAARVWHRDLKTCNLFVAMGDDAGSHGTFPSVSGALERWSTQSPPLIGLLDLEDVDPIARVTPRALMRAFAQLLGSLPQSVHALAGEALVAALDDAAPTWRLDTLWQDAQRRSRRRPIVYVARGRDVIEPWID